MRRVGSVERIQVVYKRFKLFFFSTTFFFSPAPFSGTLAEACGVLPFVFSLFTLVTGSATRGEKE